MSDVSVTAANVIAGANAKRATANAAETLTAGLHIYKDTGTGTIYKSDANASGKQTVDGFTLNGASAGQPVDYVTEDDDLTPGFTVTVGGVYVLSAAAGATAPVADLATGLTAIVTMVGKTAAKVNFKPLKGGVVP